MAGPTIRRAGGMWNDVDSIDLYKGDINEVEKEARREVPQKWALEGSKLLIKTGALASKFSNYFSGALTGSLAIGAVALGATVAHQAVSNTGMDLSQGLTAVGAAWGATGVSAIAYKYSDKFSDYLDSKLRSVESQLGILSANKRERKYATREYEQLVRSKDRDERQAIFSECADITGSEFKDKKELESAISSLDGGSASNTAHTQNNDSFINQLKEKNDIKDEAKFNSVNNLSLGN